MQKKQGELQRAHTIEFVSEHDFMCKERKWIAEEMLFVSDACMEDHYGKEHKKNRGADAKHSSLFTVRSNNTL